VLLLSQSPTLNASSCKTASSNNLANTTTRSLRVRHKKTIQSHQTRVAAVLVLPRPSQNLRRPVTFPCLGHSSLARYSCFSEVLESMSLLLMRHIKTPTPALSFLLSLIAVAFLSSRTRSPSLSFSRSRRRLRSTSGPATPMPQTKSPESRSILQHSFGKMLAETREANLGRRERLRFSRILTSDQCRRRAAMCVRVK